MPNSAFDWLKDTRPLFAAQEAWNHGQYDQAAVYHVSYPIDAPFHVACGAALLAEHVKKFRFSPAVIQRIGQITDAQGRSEFSESFLNHLQRLKLRIKVLAPPEGSVLLPGEPLLIAQGPLNDVLLMESAFRYLMLESTFWATQAALERWQNGDLDEEDTYPLPAQPFNQRGWRVRAAYIGGASEKDLAAVDKAAPREFFDISVLTQVRHGNGQPLDQIRRLFQVQEPLGELWLTDEQEKKASMSKKKTQLHRMADNKRLEFNITRFQNLYQPLLVKGHAVLESPKTAYLRQRTLKQLEQFAGKDLKNYPQGWYE